MTSASRNSIQEMITALEGQRQKVKNRFDAVVKEINGASGARLSELEEQRDNLHDDLARIDAHIQSLEQQQSNLAIQALVECLSPIYGKYANKLCGVYWRSRSSKRRTDTIFACAEDLVLEAVGDLEDSQETSVLHRFVIYLLVFKQHLKLPPTQADQLKKWASTYIPQPKNLWDRIVVEVKQSKSREQQKESCLLVRIRRSNQQSKPGAKGDRYFIEAWFVKDVDAYRKNPARIPPKVTLSYENKETGQVQKVSPDQTYSQAELESTLRQISRQCQQEFEVGRFVIQVFLPFSLMQLAVDQWHVRPSRAERGPRLGTVHDVCLRSLERWDKAQYFMRNEWSEKWRQVQDQQGSSAHQVFLESPIDDAYAMVNDPEVIGLRLTESLCGGYGSLSPVEVLETVLLDTGLPLALWMRQSVRQELGVRSQNSGVRIQESGVGSQKSGVGSRELGAGSRESEVRGLGGAAAEPTLCCSQVLHTLLENCLLSKVQQRIQKRRSAVLKVALDKQIQQSGSHLALLWDDPTIPLPMVPSGSGSSRSADAA